MANTIQDKLAYLEETKGLIKEAIVAKGVEVTDTDTFRSYADKIEAIETGGGGTTNIPDGTKFGYSEFTTVPDSIISYLETQTDMDIMFYNCRNLASIPLFDTSKCTSMSSMFSGCNSLQIVPSFNTSNCTNMRYMFSGCYSLQTAPPFDTNNCTTMSYMFSGCSSLQTAPPFDTNNCTDMSYMFSGCSSLTSVPLLNTSNLDESYNMFNTCRSLTSLGGFTGLSVSLDLYYSPLLTVDSVMNVINNAADMTSSPRTLTLNQEAFNRLTEEQIATASAKGWNIAAR